MLRCALGLLIIALIAGIFGFGRIAADSSVARICFFFFFAGFVLAAAWGLMKRRRIPPRP